MIRNASMLSAVCALACASTGPGSADSREDSLVERASAFLSGRSDTKDQASRDPAFKVSVLHICPVQAPTLGEHVLYVEQATAEALTQPYRQRLYVVEAAGPDRCAHGCSS